MNVHYYIIHRSWDIMQVRSSQFHFIESEFVQACGRNRGLREDAALKGNYFANGL
jgi:hypothetical protein